MKRTRMAATLAALSLSLGITVVGTGPADAATGGRHFIHVSTHDIPIWRAKAELFSGSGKSVYLWRKETRVGGQVLWYFTDGGDGGHVNVEVEGATNTVAMYRLPLYTDYCFNVSSGGVVKYTGDSTTGGCNAN